ncbi:MAG: hypothetical protein KAU03_00660 [Candidatus Altiarchaeales archaeon]|nr:hypothetical protein [Candidatus Altiarchaeales archaeon]
MIRRCAVCGKKIKINVDENGRYDNGHYFGKLKLPIKGTGEYKKVGTTKLLKKQVQVVEWTGKEKEIEYWECNKCYEEAMHENWLEEMIEKLYGKRCKDYEPGCACCQAWDVYDTCIKENIGEL